MREKNLARQGSSMLQIAAQSFTYTDSFNNSWSRTWGVGGGGGAQNRRNYSSPHQKKKKKKAGFCLQFLHKQPSEGKSPLRVASLETLRHSNTEVQSLSAESIKAYALI